MEILKDERDHRVFLSSDGKTNSAGFFFTNNFSMFSLSSPIITDDRVVCGSKI